MWVKLKISISLCVLLIYLRATSPQPDATKQKRTRIARTTEGVETVQRRSRPPRMTDAACQTITIPEFDTILEMKRKVKPSPSFDYFARLKQSLESAPILTKGGPGGGGGEGSGATDLGEGEGDEEEDGYKFEKAAMMQLLPGKIKFLAVTMSICVCLEQRSL